MQRIGPCHVDAAGTRVALEIEANGGPPGVLIFAAAALAEALPLLAEALMEADRRSGGKHAARLREHSEKGALPCWPVARELASRGARGGLPVALDTAQALRRALDDLHGAT